MSNLIMISAVDFEVGSDKIYCRKIIHSVIQHQATLLNKIAYVLCEPTKPRLFELNSVRKKAVASTSET